MNYPSRWPRGFLLFVFVHSVVGTLLGANRAQGSVPEPPPNVLIVVADDLGFSDLGCYGSEISTPVLDSLAANGTVFANFHTAATCSPTRAMLLTGVDHHLAGMGNMYEYLRTAPEQVGKPGYEGCLNDSVVTLAEVLGSTGYHTAISGKWHLGRLLTVDQSPSGRGFDQSWVLWAGWAENYFPAFGRPFVEGRRRVNYPRGKYSTEWYTDKAIEFADAAIDQQKPFFLMVSYTAPHWPLEAPDDLIAKQKGKYDDGFDELRRRRIEGLVKRKLLPPGVRMSPTPARRPMLHHEIPFETTEKWNELSAAQRAYSARLMEVHAAMIEAMDQQLGRLLAHLRERGQFDNTFIVFMSDNGPSSLTTLADDFENRLENVGRPGSFVAYGPEWARASNGPLRLMKGYPTEGGIRVPAIIKQPHDTRHRIASDFATVLDIAPTVYDLLGVRYPKTFEGHDIHRLSGVSMLPYLQRRRDFIHDDDYAMGWELFGRAAFQCGPWKISWVEKPFGRSDFELFDIDADPGESRDLRTTHPAVYRKMLAGFEEYVRTNGVIIARPEHWKP